MPEWVVEFDCSEAVIRRGETKEEVSGPDDLQCPPVRVRRLRDVVLRREPWIKGGQLRCEVAD